MTKRSFLKKMNDIDERIENIRLLYLEDKPEDFLFLYEDRLDELEYLIKLFSIAVGAKDKEAIRAYGEIQEIMAVMDDVKNRKCDYLLKLYDGKLAYLKELEFNANEKQLERIKFFEEKCMSDKASFEELFAKKFHQR